MRIIELKEMSEINFLSDNKEAEENGAKGDEPEEKTEWSEPVVSRPEPAASRKSGLAGWLSFFKKNNQASDKDQFGQSRPETLRLIKDYVKEREGGETASGGIIKEKRSYWPSGVKEAKSSADRPRDSVKEERGGAGDKARIDTFSSGREFNYNKEKTAKIKEESIIATDLMRGELMTFFNWKRSLMVLFGFVFLALFILAAFYGGLLYWEKAEKEKIKQAVEKHEELNQQINQAEANVDKILALEKKLELIKNLIDNHIYWTNFFKFLEENTLADVYYSNFSGDTSGQYVLAATAKDFYTIAEQIKIMRANNQVYRAGTKGGQAASSQDKRAEGVGFNLELSIDPSIFTK